MSVRPSSKLPDTSSDSPNIRPVGMDLLGRTTFCPFAFSKRDFLHSLFSFFNYERLTLSSDQHILYNNRIISLKTSILAVLLQLLPD